MNVKRGFLRAWIVLTALWFVAAYFIVNMTTHQPDPSAYFYNQIECSFEGLHSYDPRLENLRKCVRGNEAIELNLPDGIMIFGDPRRTISSERVELLREGEKRGLLPPRLRDCFSEAKRRGVLDASSMRPLSTCEPFRPDRDPPRGFQLDNPEKRGFWQRVDVPVSAGDRKKLKQNMLANFVSYQTKKRWERIKGAAVHFAGIGLLPPIFVLLLGFMVGWIVRGFRN